MNMTYETPASIEEYKIKKSIAIIKITLYSSGIMLLLIGLYLSCFNFEAALELKTVNNEQIMEVYKKSYIPPFKEIDFIINNVKTTSLNPAEEKRSVGVKYSIDVENYNNHKIKLPIISYSYRDQRDLSDKINNAIQNNENFAYVYKFELDNMIGLIFIFIAFIDLLITSILFDKLLKPIILKQNKINQ